MGYVEYQRFGFTKRVHCFGNLDSVEPELENNLGHPNHLWLGISDIKYVEPGQIFSFRDFYPMESRKSSWR